MPEFIPEHTPSRLDEFTQGYAECAEWLLPEEDKERDCDGFASSAITAMKSDCADFQSSFAAELERYQEVTGRDMASAGHDFFLTRNGHGTGFWDRGEDPVLQRLTNMAHAYGVADFYIGDDNLIYQMGAE